MNVAKIASENCLSWLESAITMRMNYASYQGVIPKVLLVEGSTDELFIKGYLDSNTTVCVQSSTYSKFVHGCAPGFNSKRTIIEVINSLTKFRPLSKIPPRIKQIPVKGMIDRDFEEGDIDSKNPDLFVTDTHDLETLILSTDESVVSRLEGCSVTVDDIHKAVFMAYQIGCLMKTMRSVMGLTKPKISSSSGDVDYGCIFTEDYRISLSKVLQLETGDKAPGSQKFKKKVETLAKDRLIRTKIDQKKCCWIIGFDEFMMARYPDLWEIVNGHDVMALLKYLNHDLALKFQSQPRGFGGWELDRQLETAVIRAYDRKQFKNTRICQRMTEAGLVRGLF